MHRPMPAGGVNYGWKFLQGSLFPDSANPDCPRVGTLPVAEYSHDVGCTVVGGSVIVARSPWPERHLLRRRLLRGPVLGIARDDGDAWQMEELPRSPLVTGSGEDEAGNLYFTNCECGYGQPAPMQAGSLWMLVDANSVPEGAEVAPTGEGAPATPTEEEPATPASGSSESVALNSGEMYFEPSDFTIPADTDVTISISNANGALPHNFTIDGTDYAVDFEAGATAEIAVNLAAGTYEFYCDIPGHKEAGMVGTLTVE